MDLTPFIPLFATVIGAGATVGGIAIKGWFDSRSENARVVREEARSADLAKVNARERVAERAHAIAGLFLDEIQAVRKFQDLTDATAFPVWFQKRWRTSGDISFRRAIAAVDDAEERTQLTKILDSIDDFETLAQWKYFHGGDQRWVEETLTLGFDLASTMARGQEPDLRFVEHYEAFLRFVSGYYADQEELRQAKEDAWRAESKASAASKVAIEVIPDPEE